MRPIFQRVGRCQVPLVLSAFGALFFLFSPQTSPSRSSVDWNYPKDNPQNTCNQSLSPTASTDLAQVLKSVKLAALGNERLTIFAEQTTLAYEPNFRCLLWVRHGEPTKQALQLIQGFKNATEKGLEPSDYDGHIGILDVGSIEKLDNHTEATLVRFDVGLTVATIRYISDLHGGRANPNNDFSSILVQEQRVELGIFIGRTMTNTSDVANEVQSVEPPFLGYQRTLSFLARYRHLAQESHLASLPIPPNSVEPGISYKGAVELRRRLELVGDLEDSPPHDPTMYDVDLAEAVIRFQQRHGLEPNGRLDGATLRDDNSLGLIKFDLPNPYNIYLHGTPAPELFLKARRDFSHGCVRVEDPVALALWLLRENPSWSKDRIEAAMHGEETMRVALSKPVPIWIVYGTAVVPEDGRIRFFRDIYGQDAELEEELQQQRREERVNP